MKRFTETTKWDDPWFWSLSPQAKLLWVFLCDHCDNAGIIQIHLPIAASKIGLPVEESHLTELESRLQALDCGKTIIRPFIRFQYGKLSRECKPHLSVLKSLERHNVDLPQLETLSKGLSNPSIKGSQTLQEKEKEKEKEQEEEKEEGVQGEFPGTGNNGAFKEPGVEAVRKAVLGGFFKRRETTVWNPKEIKAFKGFVLPCHQEDFDALAAYYRSEAPYKRTDLLTLLNNFNGEIDRAKKWKDDPEGIKNTWKQPQTSQQSADPYANGKVPMI